MSNQMYEDWTPMAMFSDHGDEAKHIGNYFVCVYADYEYFGDGRWTYMVQLPDTNVVYPGTKEEPLSWDSKADAKRRVDAWDDSSLANLRAMDTTS